MNEGQICISICAKTAAEFYEKVKRADSIADCVELRFDCLEGAELVLAKLKLIELRQICEKTFIATFRPSKRLGASRDISWKSRFGFWKDMLYAKIVETIDLEHDFPLALTNQVFTSDLAEHETIRSWHDFKPDNWVNLDDLYNEIKQSDPNFIKIAVAVEDAVDGLELMQLLGNAVAADEEFIPVAMGEAGIWTRILGLSRGALLTFASLDDESATAPGQLSAREMIEVYRVKELDEKTEIYGLIGGSVSHSVSPEMHNAVFKFDKQNAVYIPFAVKNLEEFVRRMVNPKTREIDWNLRGFAVTIPHKVEIMEYLDEIDETAKKIGAVNTVKIEDGRLYGYNTDAKGFIEPLKNSFGLLKNVKVAVCGAGGAARAVTYALRNEGADVTIFARNLAKAKILADEFGVSFANLENSTFNDFGVLVNATPLGMKKGELENETAATAEQLAGVGLVYDLVYNPFETKLMREAGKAFVPTIGGLAMLVAQAMEQQRIWTGKDAPMKEMSAAALRKLQK